MSSYNQTMEEVGFEKQKWLMTRLQRENPTVVDVGGHVGQSIEKYRLLFPECTVYSFEPHPESFRALEQRYGRLKGVCCERLALGALTGTASFYATRNSAASSILPPADFIRELSSKRHYDFSKLAVPMDTLDQVAARHLLSSIDILKIDVQGTELEVLRGAVSLLDDSRIDLIYTEAQFAETYDGQCDFNDIWNFLKNFGYILWDLFPFVHTSLGRLWTANAIFISRPVALQITPGIDPNFPKIVEEPEQPACRH